MSISLIVPTYNSSKTMNRWMSTVLTQTRLPDEILYIDGGSSDDTIALITSRLRTQDKLHTGKDAGPYDAMNKGIRTASGDIIAILNSDDEWKPGLLDLVANIFAENPATDIVHGNVEYAMSSGERFLLRPSFGFKRWLGLGLPTVHPGTFVRKRVYENVGLYDYRRFPMCADQYFIYQCLIHKKRLYYLNETISVMHQGGVSSTTNLSGEIAGLLQTFPWYRRIPATLLRYVLRNDRLYYT